jgi:hypothetical protein
LLREEWDGSDAGRASGARPPDPHAVAVALLNVLRLLSRDGPLLVAVDDVQWLDSATTQALAFVIRRLHAEPVVFLLARRVEGGAAGQATRDRLASLTELQRQTIGPLDPPAIGRLIEDRLGLSLAHPTVVLHVAAAGNRSSRWSWRGRWVAMRAWWRVGQRRDRVAPSGIAPRPAGEAVAGLPPATRDAVAVTAARRTRRSNACRPRSTTRPPRSCDPRSMRASSRSRRPDPVHPSAARVGRVGRHAAARQRLIHGRLAAIVGDPEQRARHLALAADGPDETVAAALEDAAAHARSRGAPDAAAELAGLARRRTPVDRAADARRRGLAEAEYLLVSGDALRARLLCEERWRSRTPDGARRDAATLLATIDLQAHDLREPSTCS